MLVQLLRSHPDVVSNGEVMAINDSVSGFDPTVRGDLNSLDDPDRLIQWRRKDPVTFMDQAAFYHDNAKAIGFKIKTDELIDRRYRAILEALQDDRDIKVLHLNRADLLERYVSWVMVNRVTGVTLAMKEEQRPEFEQVTIDPVACEADFLEAKRRREQADAWFENHDVLEVTYENLVSDLPGESPRLCAFLGLDHHELSTSTLKLTPPVQEVVANYDEVVAHFAGGPFASLFE